jgi:hypothetical protein
MLEFIALIPISNTNQVIKSGRMRWMGHAACMGDRRHMYMDLERPIKRPKHRWQDNITMDIQKTDGKARTGLMWFGVGTNG